MKKWHKKANNLIKQSNIPRTEEPVSPSKQTKAGKKAI